MNNIITKIRIKLFLTPKLVVRWRWSSILCMCICFAFFFYLSPNFGQIKGFGVIIMVLWITLLLINYWFNFGNNILSMILNTKIFILQTFRYGTISITPDFKSYKKNLDAKSNGIFLHNFRTFLFHFMYVKLWNQAICAILPKLSWFSQIEGLGSKAW
jgi:hypothetical protein